MYSDHLTIGTVFGKKAEQKQEPRKVTDAISKIIDDVLSSWYGHLGGPICAT